MPGAASGTAAALGLQAIFGQAVAGLLTGRNVYGALTTADPGVGTSLPTALAAEVSAAGYARQQVFTGAPSGTPETLANNAQVTWGPFTAAPGTVTYSVICSALTGTTGDFLYRFQLSDSAGNPTPKTPAINDSLIVAVGSLTASMS